MATDLRYKSFSYSFRVLLQFCMFMILLSISDSYSLLQWLFEVFDKNFFGRNALPSEMEEGALGAS